MVNIENNEVVVQILIKLLLCFKIMAVPFFQTVTTILYLNSSVIIIVNDMFLFFSIVV